MRARDVHEGQLVDLHGDPYAQEEMTQHVAEFEYAEVQGVEWETPDCIVVYTGQGAFGMPPDHDLKEAS